MSPSQLSTKSARVYVKVDPNNVPPHPGEEWTRFVCISDTHSKTLPVPLGDVLLHAGDLSRGGTSPAVDATISWLGSLGHATKMCVQYLSKAHLFDGAVSDLLLEIMT